MKITKTDIGLLILRIGLGALMLFHGIDKINDISFIKMLLTENNIWEFFAYGVYIGEILVPILLFTGFKVKIASYILIINCVVAILLVFPNELFSLNKQTGGWAIELPSLYIIGGLTLVLTGGGSIKLFNKLN